MSREKHWTRYASGSLGSHKWQPIRSHSLAQHVVSWRHYPGASLNAFWPESKLFLKTHDHVGVENSRDRVSSGGYALENIGSFMPLTTINQLSILF